MNRVRGHYFWLRRKLGMKKAVDTIKIGSREKRITNDIVHNISRQIVNRALETDALIVLGDIKHLRKREQNKHGRKFNRKLAGFQYYKLTQYIKYKAGSQGISRHNIVENAIRKVSGRKGSGVKDVVKRMLIEMLAFNIAYRALGYISKVGVTVNLPKLRTLASIDRNTMMTREATGL